MWEVSGLNLEVRGLMFPSEADPPPAEDVGNLSLAMINIEKLVLVGAGFPRPEPEEDVLGKRRLLRRRVGKLGDISWMPERFNLQN